uniref:hydroxymethylglutaryl-CoA lyase n=1 Tax=Heterorhabditis bacteriophora TaxID=37862 RepID=A0A1I7XUY7_HETBA
MGRASTRSLDERGHIKVLSTTGYTVKQIADVVKRSGKAIMNFLRHQEEYGVRLTFQQDNYTIHVNRNNKTWLEGNDVATMHWPSNTPDLNPIENLWAIVVRRINSDNRQFETAKDFQSAISKAWSKLKNGHVREIAVFGSASDSFSRKNVNSTMEESLKKLKEVTKLALKEGLKVRGYVSCVIGCPYEGKINSSVVAKVTEELIDMGCYEGMCNMILRRFIFIKFACSTSILFTNYLSCYLVSLGDTIGVGAVGSVSTMLNTVLQAVPSNMLAVHFHDTYGQALTNVFVAIQKGIRIADCSIAGLGGCPYAKGATGNLATEDLVYMLHDQGFSTVLTLLISVLGDYNTMSEAGGSSISGVSVSCFKTLENCMEECYMSCYITDHCNDSEKEMVACAPGLRT